MLDRKDAGRVRAACGGLGTSVPGPAGDCAELLERVNTGAGVLAAWAAPAELVVAVLLMALGASASEVPS